jgi:large subunit ribosomal protein L3
LKGKKMPGRMGGRQCTVENLMVVEVRPEENLLFVKGAVPGANNQLVQIRCK